MNQNNHSQEWARERAQQDEGPRSQLHLYQNIATPSTQDPFLERNNLGLGKYTDKEYWQQMQAFQSHMYSQSAFESTLSEMAIYETKWSLGKLELEQSDRECAVALAKERGLVGDDEQIGRRHAIRLLGQERWDSPLEDEIPDSQLETMNPKKLQQLEAEKRLLNIEEHSGTSSSWLSPFGRMISARHEASRSKGAHLIDNVFGRVREERQETDQLEEGLDKDDNGGIL